MQTRPSERTNIAKDRNPKFEEQNNTTYLNTTLDHLLSSKFSKFTTTAKDNRNSIFLGSSGTQGLVDIVDHDKLMDTLNSDMKIS